MTAAQEVWGQGGQQCESAEEVKSARLWRAIGESGENSV